MKRTCSTAAVTRWDLAAIALLAAAGVFRPGAAWIDRQLVRICWNVPPMWNAIADVAVRSGIIDPRLAGAPAPWRRATVAEEVISRFAVATFSDMRVATIWVLDEDYTVRGVFRRETPDPHLITQETRGIEPLSHLWTIQDTDGDGRVETLVSMNVCPTGAPILGTLAYIALGPDANELLWAAGDTPSRPARGRPTRSMILESADENADAAPDLILRRASKDRNEEPATAAVFVWDRDKRMFRLQSLTPEAQSRLRYWTAESGGRLFFHRDESVDAVVARALAGAAASAGAASSATAAGTASRP